MEILKTSQALRQYRNTWSTKTIGFVPTMGCLHAGHMALVEQAKSHCDRVIVSIFVNPLQFNQADDLHHYPRPLKQDLTQLRAACVSAVFLPKAQDLFPQTHPQTYVDIPGFSDTLAGKSRPRHFSGVATIVILLFNLVRPHHAYFGEKDYQQLALIRKLVRDLHMDIHIHGVPTARDANGLALSSRNTHLTPNARQQAAALYHHLLALKIALEKHECDAKACLGQTKARLEQHGLAVERLDFVDADTLDPPSSQSKRWALLAAVWIENVRLIDHVYVEQYAPKVMMLSES